MVIERFLLIKDEIKTLLDVGAHVGDWHTKVKALLPNVDIMSVEANPYCEKTLTDKSIPHIIALLSNNDDEKVTYYLTKKWLMSSGNSIFKENTADYSDDNIKTIELTTKTLDTLFKDKQFDVLKLDTQGSELLILEGGKQLLSRAKYVLMETSVIHYNQGAPLVGDVFVYMKSKGYVMHDIFDMSYTNDTLTQIDILFRNTNNG